MGIISHIEEFLGPFRRGWDRAAPNEPQWPFQIAAFAGGLIADVMSFVTIGLSGTPLKSLSSDKWIRHELVMLIPSKPEHKYCPSILQQIAAECLALKVAYLRGDVIGPRGTLFETGSMEALYITSPVCLPDRFGTYKDIHGHEIVFAWAAPITRSESQFVRSRGWDKFEELLEQRGVDLIDIDRESVV